MDPERECTNCIYISSTEKSSYIDQEFPGIDRIMNLISSSVFPCHLTFPSSGICPSISQAYASRLVRPIGLTERVAITISGHYDRMGNVQRVAVTPMEPTVYHCRSTLANRCTSILFVPTSPANHPPPGSPWLSFSPSLFHPLLRSLRNYKHSFHTKSSQCWRSLTVRNESCANRIFTIDCHPFAFASLSPSSTVHFTQWPAAALFPNFRDYRPPRLIVPRICRREYSKPKAGFYSIWKGWIEAHPIVKIVAKCC